jgi:fructosamine-3-kinase
VDVEPLAGGTHHQCWLAVQADGSRCVVKATPGAPPGMFEAEAEGLTALRDSGAIAAPRVIAYDDGHLAMEALEPVPGFDEALGFWERAGRALAALHAVRGPAFGWHRDNWLGPWRQVNTWAEDGHEFYARHRILRFLREPGVTRALDTAQLAAVERICADLPNLVPPPSGPALTHGDLWSGNFLATPDGAPAVIDCAVSYCWPEADLSMMLYDGTLAAPGRARAAARFLAAYHEIRPPEPGWREHLELLHLRELLSLLAAGQTQWALEPVLRLVRRYG